MLREAYPLRMLDRAPSVHETSVSESSTPQQPPAPPLSLLPVPPPPEEMREATISASKCREVGKLFPIPVMPKLTKLAEPTPMKRVAAGYDMRTLRKQVDTMHAEVALRVDLQQKLYEQNDIMFSYVHELLKAQKKNSRTMKTHVISLQEELYTLQQERAVLVSQITEAQTTKDAIRSIIAQQEGLEQRILEAQNARRASVLAGQAQTVENQEIEANLKESITQMQALHIQLEDLRHVQAEEEAEERAIQHFQHNRASLRGAFWRFRGTLRSWRGMRKARGAFRKIRRVGLMRVYYDEWMKFLKIARMIRSNARKKTAEYVRLCLAKWKVYTALEKFYHRACRNRLLTKFLSQWKELVRLRLLEYRADVLYETIEYRRNIRNIFSNWKRGIVFLEWKSEELRVKDRIAVRHLKCRILQQWRVLAAEGRVEVENRAADAVRGCILRYPFRLWRLLLQASALRKTILTSRGIANFRGNARRRRLYKYRQRAVCEEAPDLRLRGCLKRWQRRILERKYFRHRIPVTEEDDSPRNLSYASVPPPEDKAVLPAVSTRLTARGMRGLWHEDQYRYRLHQLHRRKGFSALLKWAHSASRMRNVRLGRNLGIRHSVLSSARKHLQRWYANTCLRKRALRDAEEQLKRTMFDHWCLFVPMEVREKHLERQVEHKFFLRQVAFQTSLIRRWQKRARKRYRLKRLFIQTEDKTRTCLTRRCYSLWKGQWARQLLWHERESKISAKKNFALVELKVKELEDCGREKDALDQELRETKEALARVQEALSLRAEEVVEQEATIKATTEQVLQLEASLKQSETALSDVREERQRLRLIEEVYEHDQEMIKQQQQAMQLEANQVLLSLEESTHELRQEASCARSFVAHAQEQALRSLGLEEASLEEALQASTGLQRQASLKAQEVEEVEKERDSVLGAICRVKEKLQSVTDELCIADLDLDPSPNDISSGSNSSSNSSYSKSSFFEGIQSDIRHKESEIQAMRLKAGQTEARVSSLREAIATRRQQIKQANRVEEERRAYSDSRKLESLHGGHTLYQSQHLTSSGASNSDSYDNSPEQRPPYQRYTDPSSITLQSLDGAIRGSPVSGGEHKYTAGGVSVDGGDILSRSQLSPPPDSTYHSPANVPYTYSHNNSHSPYDKQFRGAGADLKGKGVRRSQRDESSAESKSDHMRAESKHSTADLDRAMRSVSDRLQARYRK